MTYSLTLKTQTLFSPDKKEIKLPSNFVYTMGASDSRCNGYGSWNEKVSSCNYALSHF